MTIADRDPLTDLILATGWADFREQFAFTLASPACVALVAEVDGAAVGVGIGTRNGTVGWVGPIWTAPALRGRGVGRALTAEVAAALEATGCGALVLAATPLGRPVYERLGFLVDGRYHVLQGPAAGLGGDDRSVRPAAASDLAAVRAIDRWATGEDRAHVLAAFETPIWVAADAAAGRIRGYALATPWGAGPVVAPDPEDALALLRRTATIAGDGSTVAVLPAENEIGRAMLAGRGFAESRSLPRMRRGRPLPWQPAAIWRLFSFGIG
jgi:GNAT superfamily N-acetyltransferase